MSGNSYTPGQHPLGNVRSQVITEILGGRPFAGLDPEDVLKGFKMGVFEAGLVDLPLRGYTGWRATNGAFRSMWISPPDGFQWRVLAASAFILDAVTQAPAMASGPLSVVAIPAIASDNTPEVSGAGTGAVPTITAPAAPIVLASSISGPASFNGTFHMRNPDQIAAYGSEPAGDELYISVLYSELPEPAIPPR